MKIQPPTLYQLSPHRTPNLAKTDPHTPHNTRETLALAPQRHLSTPGSSASARATTILYALHSWTRQRKILLPRHQTSRPRRTTPPTSSSSSSSSTSSSSSSQVTARPRSACSHASAPRGFAAREADEPLLLALVCAGVCSRWAPGSNRGAHARGAGVLYSYSGMDVGAEGGSGGGGIEFSEGVRLCLGPRDAPAASYVLNIGRRWGDEADARVCDSCWMEREIWGFGKMFVCRCRDVRTEGSEISGDMKNLGSPIDFAGTQETWVLDPKAKRKSHMNWFVFFGYLHLHTCMVQVPYNEFIERENVRDVWKISLGHQIF